VIRQLLIHKICEWFWHFKLRQARFYRHLPHAGSTQINDHLRVLNEFTSHITQFRGIINEP
ncbi:MAG: hypothetical protein AAF653_18880, partial [Chloroflexota bacterium]